MLPANVALELGKTGLYLVGFLILLELLVRRDADAVRLMGYSLVPRYQKLQDSWHALGYWAILVVGVMLATLRHGVSWPTPLFGLLLSFTWWIGFDVRLNKRLGHPWYYVGKTARIDRAARNLAAWFSRILRRAHQLGRLRFWPRLATAQVAPERLMVLGKLAGLVATVAGYGLVLRVT